MSRVCRNCGSEVSHHYVFCKNCGTKIDSSEVDAESDPAAAAKPIEEAPAKQMQAVPETTTTPGLSPRKRKHRARMIGALSLLLLAVLLAGGYRFGQYWNSSERLISRFHTAIESQDYRAAASMFTSDAEKVVINEQSVKSYVDYLKQNDDQMDDMIKNLQKQAFTLEDGDEIESDADHEVRLVQNGRAAFLFKKYQLNVMPVHIRVTTNYKDTVVKINGEKVGVASENAFAQTFGPYFPGVFALETNLHTNWTDLNRKETATIMSGWQDYQANMELEGTDVAIDTSQYDVTGLKGNLVVNGTPTGINPFENPVFGPVLTDGTVKLAIDLDLPWGKMRTAEVPVEGSSVQMNIGDVQDKAFEDQLINQIVAFNREEVKAVASGDLTAFSQVTDHLIDDMKEKVEKAKQSPASQRTTYLGSTFDLDQIALDQQDGQWVAGLLTTGTYKYEYKQGAEWGEGLEESAFRYFTLVYDPNKKQWLVDGVSVYYDDEELGGNLKEVKEQNPVAQELDIPSTPVSMDSAELQSFMSQYLTLSVEAINARDFSRVSGMIDPQGPAYKQSNDYIPYLEKKGITEELLDVQVVSSKVLDDASMEVTTNDSYNIISGDGSSKQRNYTSTYKLVSDNNVWKVNALIQTKEQ